MTLLARALITCLIIDAGFAHFHGFGRTAVLFLLAAGGLFSLLLFRTEKKITFHPFMLNAVTVNAVTIFATLKLTRIETSPSILGLHYLIGEDNAAWLEIAARSAGPNDLQLNFGAFYTVVLSIFNGIQVPLKLLVQGGASITVATPVNSVVLAYVSLLILFPWFAASAINRNPLLSGFSKLILFWSSTLLALGFLSEAFRMGHLSAAATIFCTSVGVLGLLNCGRNSQMEAPEFWIFIVGLTLWHPTRVLAFLLALLEAVRYFRQPKYARGTPAKSSPRVPLLVVLAAFGLLVLPTLHTGLGGIFGFLRGSTTPTKAGSGQFLDPGYFFNLLTAVGGTVSTSPTLIFLCVISPIGISYISWARQGKDFYRWTAVAMYILGTAFLSLQASGLLSYGARKMIWILTPALSVYVLTGLTQLLGRKMSSGLFAASIVLLATFLLFEQERTSEWMSGPIGTPSDLSETKVITETVQSSTIVNWRSDSRFEQFSRSDLPLACVAVRDREALHPARSFEAYSCNRTLNAFWRSWDQRTDIPRNAFAWYSLGRLSESEAVGLLSDAELEVGGTLVLLDPEGGLLDRVSTVETIGRWLKVDDSKIHYPGAG